MNNYTEISEFKKYDISVVTDCIQKYIDGSVKSQEELLFAMLSGFAEKYIKFGSNHSEDDSIIKKQNSTIETNEKLYYKITNPYSCLKEKYYDFSLITKNSDGSDFIDLLNVLVDKYDNLIVAYNDAVLSDKKSIDLDLAYNCVDAYFDFLKSTVFFEGNANLNNENFRSSEFLKDIILPVRCNCSIKAEESHNNELNLGYNVSFIDAFNLDVILLIIGNSDLLRRSIAIKEPTMLDELKISSFFSMADRSFGRFIHFDNETYRITMNRQTSKIVARPFTNRSSLVSIKPIRLLEKIKCFLQMCFEDQEKKYSFLTSKQFTISIIGHTEKSNLLVKPEETELIDLCSSLSNWITNNYSEKYIVKIKNYINKADWFSCAGKKRNFDTQTICYNKGNIICEIIEQSFVDSFSLSYTKIKDIVEDSDVVFFLDPAFLYNENYKIGEIFSIDQYCSALESWDNKRRHKQHGQLRIDSIGRTIQSEMMYMNTQLNRIMASHTNGAGSICRVFRDDIILKIQEYITQKKERCAVYIYSSETIGLEVSSQANYPLVRAEQYNGKTVNIFQYCNYPIPRLKRNFAYSENVVAKFKIPFWSTVKYISLNYEYLYAKKWIDEIVEGFNSYEYLCILKHIYTDISVKASGKGKYNIECSVKIDNSMVEFINEKYPENSKKICKEIFDKSQEIILPLFEGILFKEETDYSSNFGNELMKLGFCMNIYSLTRTVDEIYFWFNYNKAFKTNDFSKFSFTAKKSDVVQIVYKELHSSNNDFFFMDKRIYATMLEQLDKWEDTNLSFISMAFELEDSDIYEKSDDNSMFSIPRALKNACERLNDINLPIYNRIVRWIN